MFLCSLGAYHTLRGAASTPSSFLTISSGCSHFRSYHTHIKDLRARLPARNAHGMYVRTRTSRLPPRQRAEDWGRGCSRRGKARGPNTAPRAHTGNPVCTSSNHFSASSPSTVGGSPLTTCQRSCTSRYLMQNTGGGERTGLDVANLFQCSRGVLILFGAVRGNTYVL